MAIHPKNGSWHASGTANWFKPKKLVNIDNITLWV
jgi:hypothetical protein